MYENYQIAYRREHALILSQILLTILKKCMQSSLENLYMWILGRKGLIEVPYTPLPNAFTKKY